MILFCPDESTSVGLSLRTLPIALPIALLLASCAPAAPGSVLLLSANVGNSLLACGGDYAYKLCDAAVERRLAQRIASEDPDVVVLQEVLGREQCAGFDEVDPGRSCHPDVGAETARQARRLLGPGYTIVCDQRRGYECTGVHTRFGAVAECETGTLCDAARTAAAVPDCPTGFSMSAVEVTPAGGVPFTLVNAHPDSNPGGECRAAQLAQSLVGVDALAAAPRALLAGDFNLDPDVDNDPAAALWVDHVGMADEGLRFRYHSGHAEKSPPYPTSSTVLGDRVIDHVVSDFATGACTTLGEAPGTERLDGGEGTDHRALLCELELPDA